MGGWAVRGRFGVRFGVRLSLGSIGFYSCRSRLYFLNGTGYISETAGSAATHIHVRICLNAASMRHFPWVFQVPLRKCMPRAYGVKTYTAQAESPRNGALYISFKSLILHFYTRDKTMELLRPLLRELSMNFT